MDIKDEFDSGEMAKDFIKAFHAQVFTKGQMLAFNFCNVYLECKVTEVQVMDLESLKRKPDGSAGGNAGGSTPANCTIM